MDGKELKRLTKYVVPYNYHIYSDDHGKDDIEFLFESLCQALPRVSYKYQKKIIQNLYVDDESEWDVHNDLIFLYLTEPGFVCHKLAKHVLKSRPDLAEAVASNLDGYRQDDFFKKRILFAIKAFSKADRKFLKETLDL